MACEYAIKCYDKIIREAADFTRTDAANSVKRMTAHPDPSIGVPPDHHC